MSLQSILYSNDAQTVGVLTQALKSAGISVHVHPERDPVMETMRDRRVDGLIVDFEHTESACRLIRESRKASPVPIFTVALTNSAKAMHQAAQLGVTLVLPKPISRERVGSSVRIARDLMVHERRRSMRFMLNVPVTVVGRNGKEQHGIAINVNRGGLGIRMGVLPAEKQHVEVHFQLSGSHELVSAESVVVWTDPENNRAGLRFLEVTGEDKLSDWIAGRSEDALQEAVRDARITVRSC